MEKVKAAILEGLNEEQKLAVQCTDGPVLIIAGAGSGKTRVLTGRVAWLLAQGVAPSSILALTFTRKAAGEMAGRVAVSVGRSSARKVVMGTFHSVFARFLREFHDCIGYPQNFTIHDQSDSVSAVKACIKELRLDESAYKAKDILSRISRAKNSLLTVEAYRRNEALLQADARAKRPKTVDVYELYVKRYRESGIMDFDDILLKTNELFRDRPDVLEEVSGRFSHIMVDEYQDTNAAQYNIIRKMASVSRNLCVVGDDSQSIYAFRGARIQNILNFRKDFPECRMFRLERNYRSTKTIVGAANSLIAHNEGRIPKNCYSEGEKGEPISLLKAYSEQEEAMSVVGGILSRMRTDHASYRDFAILYRKNSQSRAFEEQLRRRNLPYLVYSGNSFFERAEVRDLLAYFKLVSNPNDDESFKRVVNKPARAIGATSLNALVECARAGSCTLFKAAYDESLYSYGLKEAAVGKIRKFCDMIGSLAEVAAVTDAEDIAVRVARDSGIYDFYKSDVTIEGQARFSNVEELLNSVTAFVEDQRKNLDDDLDEAPVFTISDFLEDVSLLSNADTSDGDDDGNRIALMTVHSAKGLEFPYVFVVGMEENLFPCVNFLSNPSELEEERRLFYVALTRAEKAVTLSYSDSRITAGRHESNPPSRFLREISPEYLENPLPDRIPGVAASGPASLSSGRGRTFQRPGLSSVEAKGASGRRPLFDKPAVIDPDFQPVPQESLYEGERIEHNRFGKGVIKSISGQAPERRAVIRFDDYGEKIILLKFAKIRPAR
ncbi:MAG: UvrD-helicase domain-containing protein [Bacteroidales bacterium]|nr:UvrD-helicase domain-containing protein [Bacteroidales bacterium]